jgi:hypothetical protein
VIGRRDLPLLTSRPAPPVRRSPAYSVSPAPSASPR